MLTSLAASQPFLYICFCSQFLSPPAGPGCLTCLSSRLHPEWTVKDHTFLKFICIKQVQFPVSTSSRLHMGHQDP